MTQRYALIRMSPRVMALLAACFSILIRFLAPGWILAIALLMIPVYPIIGVVHWIVHFLSLVQPLSAFQSRLALTSNLLLVAAFAFQIDFGDGPCGVMPVTMILFWVGLGNDCPFKISEQIVPWIDLLLFVPVLITWMLLVVVAQRKSIERASHRPAA